MTTLTKHAGAGQLCMHITTLNPSESVFFKPITFCRIVEYTTTPVKMHRIPWLRQCCQLCKV